MLRIVRPDVANELNRLLHTLSRSLAAYVDEIKPWSLAGHGQVWTAIERLAADSRSYAERLARAIVDAGGQPKPGVYPLAFARLNDLSLEFFLREIIAVLKSDQAVVRQCIDTLARVPAARALAEEIYGNLQGHMEILEKVAAEL
jgi:hypothetical protein